MAAVQQKPFIKGETKIPLNVPSYGPEEIAEVNDSLAKGEVTMGKKVKAFEDAWARYLGVGYAIMTNSGSSANLIALTALRYGCWLGEISEGEEVITPALTWATTVFPIAQVGAVPVLVDVDLETYNISPEAVEVALSRETKAIMPVHLLGNPCDMGFLAPFCVEKDLLLVEDACEAHGAEWQGIKVGVFGEIGTFSFFFSHHISTIEGGMIVTDQEDIASLCRALRSFGWTRDLRERNVLERKYADIDPKFLFAYAGYNVRPTEVQGAMGLHQLPRLEGFIECRRRNADYWNRMFEGLGYEEHLILPWEALRTRHVYFAYPFLVRPGSPLKAKELKAHLEKRGVETRPIEAGNIARQPAMQRLHYRISGELKNSQYIHDNAFFIGCHQGIGDEQVQTVVEYVQEFMEKL